MVALNSTSPRLSLRQAPTTPDTSGALKKTTIVQLHSNVFGEFPLILCSSTWRETLREKLMVYKDFGHVIQHIVMAVLMHDTEQEFSKMRPESTKMS
jgi:hypothetical protein